MLSDQDFAAWAKRVGLSNEALSGVAHVRCSNPARRVGGGHSNVTGRYPSKKMGVTIQFESHRVELPLCTNWSTTTRYSNITTRLARSSSIIVRGWEASWCFLTRRTSL